VLNFTVFLHPYLGIVMSFFSIWTAAHCPAEIAFLQFTAQFAGFALVNCG
jgi:hypothetical protein